MNSKFTPGPWEWVSDDHTALRSLTQQENQFSATGFIRPIVYEVDWEVDSHHISLSADVSDADAYLIASAPEMYEALIRCISELERASSMGINIVPGVIEDACDALRKARGEA